MATRQEKQIVDDIIRFANIMNDLLDVAALHLKEIDEETGGKLQVSKNGTFRDITVDELVSMTRRAGQNVLGYYQTITDFIDNYGQKNLEIVLLSFGYDPVEIMTDISIMQQEARNIVDNVGICKEKADLQGLAERIDNNVSKLTLVRRSWCLGR